MPERMMRLATFEKLGRTQIPDRVRYLFVSLLLLADDYGFLPAGDSDWLRERTNWHWRSHRLGRLAAFEEDLFALEREGFIRRVEEEGCRYLRIENWDRDQHLVRPRRSFRDRPPGDSKRSSRGTKGAAVVTEAGDAPVPRGTQVVPPGTGKIVSSSPFRPHSVLRGTEWGRNPLEDSREKPREVELEEGITPLYPPKRESSSSTRVASHESTAPPARAEPEPTSESGPDPPGLDHTILDPLGIVERLHAAGEPLLREIVRSECSPTMHPPARIVRVAARSPGGAAQPPGAGSVRVAVPRGDAAGWQLGRGRVSPEAGWECQEELAKQLARTNATSARNGHSAAPAATCAGGVAT